MGVSGKALIKSIRGFEVAFIILACVSLAILFFPKGWLTHTVELSPRHYPARLSVDNEGESTATWINQNRQIWRCNLDPKYQNSYCGMVLTTLDERWRGLDLSRFDRMVIQGDYSGHGEYIRIYLRNRHPRYYQIGNENSTKYNMVEIPVDHLVKGLPIKMSDFHVADWWRAARGLPVKYARAEFRDIIFIEFQSGSVKNSGERTVQIKNILFKGQLVANETLYRFLAIIWALGILAFLALRLLQLNREAKHSQRYWNELISINSLLNLQNKQLEDLAKTDPLTGVFNRVGIRDALLKGLNDFRERQKPFSYIIIDLDHFKQINDTYGHDAGDQVLSTVAKLFDSNIRESDTLARWGGEEFVILCQNTVLKQAIALAELLREELNKTPAYRDIKVTASFGVAALSDTDLSALFKRADNALYHAKSMGRNCVRSETDVVRKEPNLKVVSNA